MADERQHTPEDEEMGEHDEAQEDFAALFEEATARGERPIQKDSKIQGTVVSIGEEWLFVDIGGKERGEHRQG